MLRNKNIIQLENRDMSDYLENFPKHSSRHGISTSYSIKLLRDIIQQLIHDATAEKYDHPLGKFYKGKGWLKDCDWK